MGSVQSRSTPRVPAVAHPSTVTVLGAVLLVVAVVSVTAAMLIGQRAVEGPAVLSAAAVRQLAQEPGARLMKFVDRADGGIVVSEVPSGTLIKIIPPETDHFIRTIMRSLVRERRTLGLTDVEPFALSREPVDGRLALTDLATGRRIELNAFGPTNFGAFAQLLDARTIRGSGSGRTE